MRWSSLPLQFPVTFRNQLSFACYLHMCQGTQSSYRLSRNWQLITNLNICMPFPQNIQISSSHDLMIDGTDQFLFCWHTKGRRGRVLIICKQFLVNQKPSNTLKHLTRRRDCITIHKSRLVTSRVSPSRKQLMNYRMCFCVNACRVLEASDKHSCRQW